MDENLIVELENEGIVSGTFRKLSSAKKNKIYRAALEAFAADVYDRVSLDDIADAAEISKGSLIQYFVHKENLYGFVGEVVLNNYLHYWDGYWAGLSAPRFKNRLENLFLGYDKFRVSYPGETNFVLKSLYENSSDLSAEFSRRIFQLDEEFIGDIVRHGIQTRQIRRDIKIKYAAFFIHQIFIGIVRMKHYTNVTSGTDDSADRVENCMGMILNGLKG